LKKGTNFSSQNIFQPHYFFSQFSFLLLLLFLTTMNIEQNLRGLRDSLVVADLSALDSVKMSEGLDMLWEDLSIATLATLDDMVAGF